MTQRPRSRIGFSVSIIAAVLMAGAIIAMSLGSEFDILFLPLSFLVGMVGLAITTIELLAGYRGRPQKLSLGLGGVSCLLPALYYVALGSSGAGN